MRRRLSKFRLAKAGKATQRLAQGVVRFTGDLTDCDAITDLLMQCKAAMKQHRQSLIVDLTEVQHADTKLIAALVILRRWAASIGVELVLQLPGCVQRWLSVCRLESLAPSRE